MIASWLVLGTTLLSASAFGIPSTDPAAAAEHSLFGAAAQTVDDLDVPAGSSVSDLLHRLQQLSPGFQYVAEPGPWQNASLPQMRLRAVTEQQIVEMLMNVVPDFQVANISGGGHTLYVFRTRKHSGTLQSKTDLGAFGLGDPVERIGLRNAWADVPKDRDAPTAEQIAAGRKKALKQVLSLLESAATQADPSSQPTLKLHEETEVLLVKGTPAQLNAVSQSLTALGSSVATNTYNANYSHLADQYRFSKNQVSYLTTAVERGSEASKSLADRVSQLEKENAALRSELRRTIGKNGADEKH